MYKIYEVYGVTVDIEYLSADYTMKGVTCWISNTNSPPTTYNASLNDKPQSVSHLLADTGIVYNYKKYN